MSEHYPKIRVLSDGGFLVMREGLSLCFYMKRPHREIAPMVMRALERYAQAIGGMQELSTYLEDGLYWQALDEAGWKQIRHDLLERKYIITLGDGGSDQQRYFFDYYGKPLDDPSFVRSWLDDVSAVSFGLPTEWLEEHGPEKVRQLARDLAELLPFNSGHAGLSFNGGLDLIGVNRKLREYCFRYPGIDITASFLESEAMHLGTRVRGPAWMTFLGQPVLGALGGVEGLRSRLRTPGTTVEAMSGDRAVLTLGEWPEAGDTEQGLTLPAYRELARVLEPWLYRREHAAFRLTEEETKRWENRFFD